MKPGSSSLWLTTMFAAVCATLAGGSVPSETPTTHLGDIGVTFDPDKIFH